MGYAIELSFDIRKIKNINEEQKIIYREAVDFGCISQYHLHEMEGYGRNTIRSDYIHIVMFDSENFEYLIDYIRHIRKQRKLCIECIYKDDTNCDLLYASSKFIKRMDKQSSLCYRREKKKEGTCGDDSLLTIQEKEKSNEKIQIIRALKI